MVLGTKHKLQVKQDIFLVTSVQILYTKLHCSSNTILIKILRRKQKVFQIFTWLLFNKIKTLKNENMHIFISTVQNFHIFSIHFYWKHIWSQCDHIYWLPLLNKKNCQKRVDTICKSFVLWTQRNKKAIIELFWITWAVQNLKVRNCLLKFT